MIDSGITHAVLARAIRRFHARSTLLRTWPLKGGTSAQMTVIEIERPDGQLERLVLRRHGARDKARNPRIAADEFRLLQFLRSSGVAVPMPLYLDETGDIFGSPFLVLEYVDGEPLSAATAPHDAMLQLASLLATIHRLDALDPRLSFLPKQDDVHAEFMDRVQAEPAGAATAERIRTTLRPVWPISPQNPPALLHGDVWPGNIICRNGRIAALVDWEDVALGDPLSDIGNIRLELFWSFGADAAASFTSHYRAMMPLDVTRLPEWDLRAALRWLSGIANWGLDATSERTMRERHETFVARALAALSDRR